MNIYPSTKVRPYVYFGYNPLTGEFYIGYREANTQPSHIDLFEYRTSSDIVIPIFDQMIWTILAEFEIGNDAYDFEQQLIYENWNNPLLLNEVCYYNKKRFKNRQPWNKGIKMAIEQTKNMKKPKTEKHKLSMRKPKGPHSQSRKDNISSAVKKNWSENDQTQRIANISSGLKGNIPHNKGKSAPELAGKTYALNLTTGEIEHLDSATYQQLKGIQYISTASKEYRQRAD